MTTKWTRQDLQRVAGKGMTVNLGVLDSQPRIRYVIGIDPGKNTGIAVYDRETNAFTEVSCMLIHQAMSRVKKMAGTLDIMVRLEDARQRKWFGASGREKLQGAGSVKRDSVIWEDFLSDEGITYELVKPGDAKTKVPADKFKNLTGWHKRSNGHARDAAMLCWKY